MTSCLGFASKVPIDGWSPDGGYNPIEGGLTNMGTMANSGPNLQVDRYAFAFRRSLKIENFSSNLEKFILKLY